MLTCTCTAACRALCDRPGCAITQRAVRCVIAQPGHMGPRGGFALSRRRAERTCTAPAEAWEERLSSAMEGRRGREAMEGIAGRCSDSAAKPAAKSGSTGSAPARASGRMMAARESFSRCWYSAKPCRRSVWASAVVATATAVSEAAVLSVGSGGCRPF